MLLATAKKGMLEARSALAKSEGVSLPSYISEHTQRLAQYTGSVEESLAKSEADLVKLTAEKFKAYMTDGKSANMAGELLKYDFTEERAEVVELTRLCNSSWKIISVSQSRVKHLIAEATNQI
jgi:hypothetical protein